MYLLFDHAARVAETTAHNIPDEKIKLSLIPLFSLNTEKM